MNQTIFQSIKYAFDGYPRSVRVCVCSPQTASITDESNNNLIWRQSARKPDFVPQQKQTRTEPCVWNGSICPNWDRGRPRPGPSRRTCWSSPPCSASEASTWSTSPLSRPGGTKEEKFSVARNFLHSLQISRGCYCLLDLLSPSLTRVTLGLWTLLFIFHLRNIFIHISINNYFSLHSKLPSERTERTIKGQERG